MHACEASAVDGEERDLDAAMRDLVAGGAGGRAEPKGADAAALWLRERERELVFSGIGAILGRDAFGFAGDGEQLARGVRLLLANYRRQRNRDPERGIAGDVQRVV